MSYGHRVKIKIERNNDNYDDLKNEGSKDGIRSSSFSYDYIPTQLFNQGQ